MSPRAGQELLPTDCRAVGLALCSQSSRIGGFCAPFALLFGDSAAAVPCTLPAPRRAAPKLLTSPAVPCRMASCAAAPAALWAALAILGGLSTLRLPETLGEPSLESLDDLHALMARRESSMRRVE